MRAAGPVHSKTGIRQIFLHLEKQKKVLSRLNTGPGIKRLLGDPTMHPRQQHPIEVVFSREAKPAARF